ncbi:hypothetical protein DYQ86_19940 [Acidobacteria bacterium AB60]|nr:hypothetical protein DYQ86_19940 [Acidobacteria bacterium AB60]
MPNTELILIVLVAVIAGALIVMLIIAAALFFAVKKGMKAAGEYATELREKVVPAIDQSKEVLQSTKQLIHNLEPKLVAAATNVVDVTATAKAEIDKLSQSTEEITDRVRRQAARVEGMTTEALNGVDRVGHVLNQVVTVPVRQVSGVMAAAKAVIETLRAPAPPRNGYRGSRS